MRKTLIYLSLTALAAFSCTKPGIEPQLQTNNMSITAVQLSTKTHLSGADGTQIPILWDAEDHIWLRSAAQQDGSMGSLFTTKEAELKDGGRTAIFRGNSIDKGPYVAIYPYEYVSPSSDNSEIILNVPRIQTYSAKSFGAQANITAAVWESGSVATFNNLVATLKIKVTRESGICRIVLKDKDESSILWGKCRLVPGKDKIESISWVNDSEDKNKVTLVNALPEGSDKSGTIDYFFVIPAGTLEKGFTCELCDAASRVVKTVVVPEGCKVSPGTIINLNEQDPELADFSGGKGSAEDPYRISTAADLVSLSEKCESQYDKYAHSHYIQTADIVMNKVRFCPIGMTEEKAFKGSYDGGGHSISNLSPRLVLGTAYGMFAWTDGAKIKNLKLNDFKNTGSSQNSAALAGYAKNTDISDISIDGPLHFYNLCCGSVVGQMEGGTVSDCHYKGFMQNEKRASFENTANCTVVGGIAGNVKNNALIKGCTVSGNVTGIGMYVAGIAACLTSSKLQDCKVLAGSTVVGDNFNTGGIAALMRSSSEIRNCSMDASVACWYHELGGIVSRLEDGKIFDCVVGSNAQVRCGMGKTGGIAGCIASKSEQHALIDGCVVYGDITGTWGVGGIVGYIEPTVANSEVNIINSAFTGGDIWTSGFFSKDSYNYAFAGGIAGWARLESGGVKGVNIVNCFTDPACLRIEWKQASRLGVGGILGNHTGSVPVKISGCYTTLTTDRMRFNGGGDFSSMHYFGAVVGTAGTSVSLNNAYYLKGMKIGYDPSSLHLTDTDGLPLAKALDGTLLKKLNDFVSGGAGAFELKKWITSPSGYPSFENMPVNPSEGKKQPLRVSLIGDSISSFDGYVPHGYKNGESEGDAANGYHCHYPSGDGNVTSAAQTYWYILTYNLLKNAILDTNLGFSGTAVTRCTNTDYSSKYWYNHDFCKRYLENGGMGHPDIILINGGANDWARPKAFKLLDSVPVTSKDAPGSSLTSAVFEKADACTSFEDAVRLPDETFFEAYVKLVKMMIFQYPNVKIVIIIHDTLSEGLEKSMIMIAEHYKSHCRYVDLYAVNGFNDLGFDGEYLKLGYQPNMPKHDFDWSIKTISGHGDHPSAQAMKFIADKIYKEQGAWLESGVKWSDANEDNIDDFKNNNGKW